MDIEFFRLSQWMMKWLNLTVSAESHIPMADSLGYIEFGVVVVKTLFYFYNTFTILKWKHDLTIVLTIIDNWFKHLLIILNFIEWNTFLTFSVSIVRNPNSDKTSTWLWSCKPLKCYFCLLWSYLLILWNTPIWQHVLIWYSAMEALLLALESFFKYFLILKPEVFI